MISKSKIPTTIAGVAAVILVGVGVGWFFSRAPGSATKFVLPPQVESKPASTNVSRFFSKPEKNNANGANDASADVPMTDTNILADWEDRLDDILGANDTDTDQKAKKMLELFPRMPEAGQLEAARHLSNLLRDEDYPPLGRYLADPKTPPSVLEELMTDVLNRPNSMKLPLLLDVASNPDHPKAAEAKETLELYLEEDYGTNWNVWKQKVDEQVKENPD